MAYAKNGGCIMDKFVKLEFLEKLSFLLFPLSTLADTNRDE
jgi:hypothetical protein